MTTTQESIRNRAADHGGLPALLVLPALANAGAFFFGAALFLTAPFSNLQWLGWLFLVFGLLSCFVAWGSLVAVVDVGPDRIVVHRRFGSWVLPTDDIALVEAHRHWQSPYGPARPPMHRLLIRRRSGFDRQIAYLSPAAGDRLLFDLYQLRKPITVFNWQ